MHHKQVMPEDTARFEGEELHPVCSTFTLAREIEWSTRLFVLDMKDPDEEGVGTYLSINHVAPAHVGETLEIEARFESLVKNELICNYTVRVGTRVVATGKTGQKIFKKDHLKSKLGI